MKQRLALLLACLTLLMLLPACGEASPDTIRVFAMKGPTGMGMAKLISDSAAAEAPLYDVTIAASPDAVAAEVIKGAYDIAAVPANLAATLYAKTAGQLYVAAVNTLGVLYVLENGNTIQSIEDLNGKTIYATGQASTPEYVLQYILAAHEIDCEVIYLTEHAELATQMSAGSVKLGMLPVPNVTAVLSSNPDVRIALDLTEEWEKAAAKNGDSGALYQGCIILRREFADTYPAAVKQFLAEYEASVTFVQENPEEASLMIEAAGIIPKAAVAKKALPDANIVFIAGEEMKAGLHGFFGVLHSFHPASVGGQVPDEAIYYLD